MRRALLVSGAGRSGTSTVAGSLALLGLHVPQPEVEADSSNPRGFFESQWVVDFHKHLLDRSPVVRTIDARPEAVDLVAARAADPEAAAELAAWLDGQVVHDQLLVKDPRVCWFHQLWRDAVTARGAELVFLTMLRHPIEVASSRDTHYVADRDELFRRRRAVANVAAWCNLAFVAESVTRGDRRVFVRYTDLLADWRAALLPVQERLGRERGFDLTSREHHAVDDFIDVRLRRSDPSWDQYDMPDELREIADAVWGHMNRLADDPDDPEAIAALDELRPRYARLHDHAVGISLDYANAREVAGRRSGRWNTARQYDERVADLEKRLRRTPTGFARRVVRYSRRRLGNG